MQLLLQTAVSVVYPHELLIPIASPPALILGCQLLSGPCPPQGWKEFVATPNSWLSGQGFYSAYGSY